MVKNCKHKINKKSFQNLCKDKLDFLKLQLCRNEVEELIYELGICKDEKIDYVALHSFTSSTTVKRVMKRFYDRACNLPLEVFNNIFGTI
jgi:hypothetical protein